MNEWDRRVGGRGTGRVKKEERKKNKNKTIRGLVLRVFDRLLNILCDYNLPVYFFIIQPFLPSENFIRRNHPIEI